MCAAAIFARSLLLHPIKRLLGSWGRELFVMGYRLMGRVKLRHAVFSRGEQFKVDSTLRPPLGRS
jgi:hypothetical protein